MKIVLGVGLLFAATLITTWPTAATCQTKRPLEVIHVGDDSAGEQLVYLLRDHFRGSASFELTPIQPLFRINVTTIDSSQITARPSTTYAVVLTYMQTDAQNAFYNEAYITSLVGSCPEHLLATCAEDLYNQSATEAELTLDDIAKFVARDTRRLAEEALARSPK